MALLQVASNAQITEAEKKQAIPTEPPKMTRPMTGLATFVRQAWQKAYEAKMTIQTQLLDNLRSFNSEYNPSDLNEIKKLQGSEQFLALSGTKCIAALSWLTDTYDQPGKPPWDIEPTPKPELPSEMEQQIRFQVVSEIANLIQQYTELTGLDPQQLLQRVLPGIRRRVDERIKDKAKEGIEELKLIMNDQLVEGGWYNALFDCLFDLVVFKASILKGPIFRKQRRFKRVLSPFGYMYENSIEDVIIPTFERKSPFNIYPGPASEGVENSYLCDLDTLTLKQIQNLIGVEGFNDEALEDVLQQYKTGGLREWARMSFETEKLAAEKQSTYIDYDKVDVVEFWGDVPGSLLLEEGMSAAEIDNPHKRYDVCVYLVDNKIIKAMLNPNPMGMKPYSISSYIKIPGTFWGRGLTELISDLQKICNAITRAMINNAAISSGPMVEFDAERVPPGQQQLYPWKIIESTDKALSGSPAVRFYQPELTAVALSRVLSFFIQLADQYSVPSYSHGDVNVGGGGQTASGLSMLMSSANRIVKRVVKNADDMIKASLMNLFFYNVYFNADKFTFIGDVNIMPQGVTSVLQEEQLAMRRIEFLNATNNPVDLQIVGAEGRRELLREVASTIDLDNLAKVLPQIDEIDGLRAELEQIIMQSQQAALEEQNLALEEEKLDIQRNKATGRPKQYKKPKNTNLAGSLPSGQDNRLIRQRNAGQM